MRAGQRVQLKPLPQLAEAFRLGARSTGTVLCSYRLARDMVGNEFLDIRLDSQITLWGVAADAFEESGALNSQSPMAESQR
ncbi:MAG: hypothetical protein ACK4MV_18040 [Beijerinckiaceae bacterium]